ncbi:hypothetical protein QMK33_04055 [Hymenobacter sp. H14-R3]|uniref:hypothetical protein n=1 Tax=Hymenobacter sp. H14-R3 TaxID=3046308 RepID=UPI0024BA83F8|nr:hypothetical protein [Hymenobacter sp. H14-R3]MDJ0364312.1 hypothetical protein [Hymenobacter sp. H14-R3]
MKTFTLSHIPHIQDFQFLTDSSGFVLDGAGHLHRFVGNTTELVATPPGFRVAHFHFITPRYGAIVGNATPGEPAPQQGGLGGAGLLATLLVLLALALRRRRRPAARVVAGLLAGLAGAATLVACSPAWHAYRRADASSAATTLLTRTQLEPGAYHYYLPNKKQQAFIAITRSQGQAWDTHRIPTSFFTTALTAIGDNFLVGTYANEQEGPLPLHGDGDIWLYGTDATYARQLAGNTPQHPFHLRVSRGIVGFTQADSLLLVFGSDRMPTLPANELSATPGNIYTLPLALGPHARLIDVPDTVDVRSLATSATGELWATLAGRKPHVAHGKLFYVPLPTKRLLRFGRGQWQAVALPEARSFEQVAFVPGTHAGYLLTEAGELLETRNDGQDWRKAAPTGIRKMHPYQRAITLLRGENQLLIDKI